MAGGSQRMVSFIPPSPSVPLPPPPYLSLPLAVAPSSFLFSLIFLKRGLRIEKNLKSKLRELMYVNNKET